MRKISLRLMFFAGLVLISLKVITTLWPSDGTSDSSLPVSAKSFNLTVDRPAIVPNNKSSKIKDFSDYQDKLAKDFKSLPTIDDLQNLTPDEVHHTPEIIKDGGELIGQIHHEAELAVAKRADALGFFKRCAEDQEIATPIRAVCLSKVYKLVPHWKIPAPLSETKISDKVMELALKLP